MGQSGYLRRGARIALVLCACMLGACRTSTLYSTVAAAPPAATSQAPAAALGIDPAPLIMAERNAAAALDIATLAALWDEEARIVEVRGVAGPADDYTWRGREAILDRYRVAVFAGPPPPLNSMPPVETSVSGDSATVQNGVDTWHFVRRAGRWWIRELVIDAGG